MPINEALDPVTEKEIPVSGQGVRRQPKLLSRCAAARQVLTELQQRQAEAKSDAGRPEREARWRIEALPGSATFFGKAIVLFCHPLAARVYAERQKASDEYFEIVRATDPSPVRPDSVNRVKPLPEVIIFIPQKVKDTNGEGFKPWLLNLTCEQIYDNHALLSEALRERRTAMGTGKDIVPPPGVLVRGEAKPHDVSRLCGRHDGGLLDPVESRHSLLLYLCGWDWGAGAFLYQNVFLPGFHRENPLFTDRLDAGIEAFAKAVSELEGGAA